MQTYLQCHNLVKCRGLRKSQDPPNPLQGAHTACTLCRSTSVNVSLSRRARSGASPPTMGAEGRLSSCQESPSSCQQSPPADAPAPACSSEPSPSDSASCVARSCISFPSLNCEDAHARMSRHVSIQATECVDTDYMHWVGFHKCDGRFSRYKWKR